MSTNLRQNKIDPTKWISQAEAARIRGVSRQAIHRLIQRGRLETLEIGGKTLVNRDEIEEFEPRDPGRPSKDQAS